MRSAMRARLLFSAALGLAALSLSSCGGSGGSGGTGTVTVPPVTPSPTSTPTPSPSPSPTPSPASYLPAFAFSSNVSYPSPVAELHYIHVRQENGPATDTYEGGDATMFASAGAATISYDPVTASAATFFRQRLLTYPSSSLSASADGARSFHLYESDPVNYRDLLWTHQIGAAAAAIVVETEFACPPAPHRIPERCDETVRNFLVGPETLPGDLPTTGSARFLAFLEVRSVPQIARGLSMNFDVTVDYDRGTVSADGIYATADSAGVITRQHYRLTGTLRRDVSPRLTGTFEIVDTPIKGNFIGNLYGPQGHDLGLIFTLDGLGSPGIGLLSAYKP